MNIAQSHAPQVIAASRLPSDLPPAQHGPAAPSSAPAAGPESLRPVVRHNMDTLVLPRPSRLNTFAKGASAALLLAGALFAGVLFAESKSIKPKSAQQTPPPASSPVRLNADQVKEVTSKDLATLAMQGDKGALQDIEEKDAWSRSIDESIAISAVRIDNDRQEARVFGKKFQAKSPEDISKSEIKEALTWAGNPRTFREGLTTFANMPNTMGPDLLYRVTRKYRRQDEVVRLANMLLGTLEVSERASPALSVILEAGKTESCEDARALLEEAQTNADRRAVRHLAKFASRVGCGVNGTKDCYPCLRSDRLIVSSLRDAQGRREPY